MRAEVEPHSVKMTGGCTETATIEARRPGRTDPSARPYGQHDGYDSRPVPPSATGAARRRAETALGDAIIVAEERLAMPKSVAAVSATTALDCCRRATQLQANGAQQRADNLVTTGICGSRCCPSRSTTSVRPYTPETARRCPLRAQLRHDLAHHSRKPLVGPSRSPASSTCTPSREKRSRRLLPHVRSTRSTSRARSSVADREAITR